jgi:hypothetical protein
LHFIQNSSLALTPFTLLFIYLHRHYYRVL